MSLITEDQLNRTKQLWSPFFLLCAVVRVQCPETKRDLTKRQRSDKLPTWKARNERERSKQHWEAQKRNPKSTIQCRSTKLLQFPVAMAKGSHLFPFRTQKLSPSAPMVLGWTRPGRVGRRRIPWRASEKSDALLLLFQIPIELIGT